MSKTSVFTLCVDHSETATTSYAVASLLDGILKTGLSTPGITNEHSSVDEPLIVYDLLPIGDDALYIPNVDKAVLLEQVDDLCRLLEDRPGSSLWALYDQLCDQLQLPAEERAQRPTPRLHGSPAPSPPSQFFTDPAISVDLSQIVAIVRGPFGHDPHKKPNPKDTYYQVFLPNANNIIIRYAVGKRLQAAWLAYRNLSPVELPEHVSSPEDKSFCDECGNSASDGDAGLVGSYHLPWCSLYTHNVVP